MLGQIISIRSIALAAPLLLWGAGIGVPANTARADDCLAAPTSATPKGSHWYYRTDRTKSRKCWYLRVLDPPTQNAAAQDASAAAPAARSGAVEKPATASTSTPASTSTRNSAVPVPPPKQKPESLATTHEPVQQPTKEEPTAPPIRETPAPSRQTSVWEPAAAPVASVWPDPPKVATVKRQKPNLGPNTPDPIRSPVEARSSREGVARDGALTTQTAKLTAPSTETLVGILLVIGLGLIAAGLLYRGVKKIAAVRDQRLIMDHSELGWVHDDIYEHEVRVARQQHKPANKRENFVDGLHLSLVPAAGDPTGHRRPESYGLRESRTSQVSDELTESNNRCAQLLRDLDQLLNQESRRSR